MINKNTTHELYLLKVMSDIVRERRNPSRSQMIDDVLKGFKTISMMDPITRGSDVPEALVWLNQLSTAELRVEWESLKKCDS